MTHNQTNKENMNIDNTFSPMKLHKKPKKDRKGILKELNTGIEGENTNTLNEEELNLLFSTLKDADEPKRDFREM